MEGGGVVGGRLSCESDALRSPDVGRAVQQLPGHKDNYYCMRVIKKKGWKTTHLHRKCDLGVMSYRFLFGAFQLNTTKYNEHYSMAAQCCSQQVECYVT